MRDYRGTRIPKHCHPLVRKLFEKMRDERITKYDVAERAGYSDQTLRDWNRSTPRLDTFVACANVIGYDVVLVPRKDM